MSADGRDSLVTTGQQARAGRASAVVPVVNSILDDLLCFVSFPAAVLEEAGIFLFSTMNSLVKESA